MTHRLVVGSVHARWELVDRVSATDEDRRRAMPAEDAVRAMRALLDDPWAGAEAIQQLRTGALDRHLSRSLARNHVGPAFLRAVADGRVLVLPNVHRRVGRAAGVLVITDDSGDDLRDTTLVAKALHGPGVEVHVVRRFSDLVGYLKELDSIRRLVFMLHGAPGEMKVGDDSKLLSEVAKALREKHATPRVAEIVFEGCHVGSGGEGIAAIMEALHADSATGYAAFHGWGITLVPVVRGETAKEIEESRGFARIKRFIIAGQPTPAEMAQHPGSHRVAFEYFSSTPVDGSVFRSGLSGQVERLVPRARMDRQPFSMANAASARQYDTVVGSMTIVTISRPK